MPELSIPYIASQIIVVIAYIALGIGLTKKERIKILTFSTIFQVLMVAHYALLIGVTGIIASIIALCRNFLFIFNEKKSRKNPAWVLILFSVIAIALTAIFYKSPSDVFPCVLTLIGIYSYWCTNTKVTRIGNLFISVCYILYAIPLHSWFAVACELYCVISTLIGYYKHERRQHTNG